MTAVGMPWRDRRGAAALEFALVASLFIPLCLACLDVGLLFWTKGALQAAAALTARCAAIGSSQCSNTQQYAVTAAQTWLFHGVITTANVTPAPAVVCLSHTQLMKVTISCGFWASGLLPRPFRNYTLTVVAYFPTSATAC